MHRQTSCACRGLCVFQVLRPSWHALRLEAAGCTRHSKPSHVTLDLLGTGIDLLSTCKEASLALLHSDQTRHQEHQGKQMGKLCVIIVHKSVCDWVHEQLIIVHKLV